MAKILTQETVEKIKRIKASAGYKEAAEKGWLCEGNDMYEPHGLVLFNNDTDEVVYAGRSGRVYNYDLNLSNLSDIRPYIDAECKIARLVG